MHTTTNNGVIASVGNASMTSKHFASPKFLQLRRRAWLASSLVAGMLSIASRSAAAESPARTTELNTFRVKSVVELSGEVHLKSLSVHAVNKSGKPIAARKVPIRSISTLDFDEQYQSGKSVEECVSYQYFHEAKTEITVDRTSTKTELREPCREIVRFGTANGFITASPDQPLFAAERDLVEGSINSIFLDQLLTDKEVEISDKWTVERSAACNLFNLDAIQDGKLEVCLVNVDEEKAQLEIEGELTASVRQVATNIKLKGKAVMDRKSGTISWFAANFNETREIGEAEPGFAVQAQLRILRAPIDEMTSSKTLAEVSKRISNLSSASLLQFQSDLGYYRFLADRRWSTYRDNGEEATLRFVVDNRLIAQCNITNLVDFEAGRQLTLEGYEADIKKLIMKQGGDVADASERLNGTGTRVLRISATGSVEGVDIRWVHYHLSNDHGRRLSMVFTLNEEYGEVFADQDQQIVGVFELLDWPSKLDPKALDEADQKKAAESKSGSKDDSLKAKSSFLSQPLKARN